jgi:hypothetical protein
MIYSETFTFKPQCGCIRYDQYRFAWLNRLGGIDTYTFRLKAKTNVNIERKEYSRYLSRWNEAIQNYGYDIGDRGKQVFDVQSFDIISVVSTWQTEEEHKWIEELFTSPAVYLIDYAFSNSTYIPIVITSNSVEIRDKKGSGNRLLSHNIEFIYAYKKVIQRG